MADESNDDLDREAEPLWAVRDVTVLLRIYQPYGKRRASIALGRNPNLDRDEAMQAADVGLWKAIVRFDPTNGTRFTTFAQRWVDGAIMDAAREADTAPTKLRTAEKKGEVAPLPVMFPLADGFDAAVKDGELPLVTLDIAELLESVNGIKSLTEDINAALDFRWDFEDIGKEWGCSAAHAAYTVKLSLERAKDPDAYRQEVKNRPPFEPQTDGPRVQQTMF